MVVEAITVKDTLKLRKKVIDTCLFMKDKLGFFIGTWGNISVRVEDGLLLTPSRIKYHELKPSDLVVITLQGERVKGSRVPTSEMELHRQIMLERPDIGAIVHCHSTYASTMAAIGIPLPVICDDMAEVIGGVVNCTEYVPAGRHMELATAARKTIGRDSYAVLIGNHGAVAGGRNLDEAIVCCQFLEKSACIYLHSQVLGGAKPIPEDLWREERNRYLYKYGKAEDLKGVILE